MPGIKFQTSRTDLAHMEEFMRGATESDSGLVNQVMPLIQKLCQHLSDSYGQKVNDKRQTFITGFLNKRRVARGSRNANSNQ